MFPSADVTLTAVWELKTWTLGEAVGADATSAALAWTTGGAADWTVDAANGWTDGVSAKSGAVASGEQSWIETTVKGAGTLVFRWNVMGGIYRNSPFAYAKVEVDGEAAAQEYATDGWKEQTVEIEGAGAHTVRWTYLRTSARAVDGDCAWLDAVAWTPSAPEGVVVDAGGGKTVTVPAEWIAESGTTRAAMDTAANRRKVWECYVLGLDPEDATKNFKITALPMNADGTPDFANMAYEPSKDKWNVPGARAVVKGKARIDDATEPWRTATDENKADMRFFRVEVELP